MNLTWNAFNRGAKIQMLVVPSMCLPMIVLAVLLQVALCKAAPMVRTYRLDFWV